MCTTSRHEELVKEDFWQPMTKYLMELEGKPYCKFQKRKCHFTTECQEIHHYIKHVIKHGFLDDYLKLGSDDLPYIFNRTANTQP